MKINEPELLEEEILSENLEEDINEPELLEEEILSENLEEDELSAVISTLDEEEVDEAPTWVKDLRQRNRDLSKKVRELQQQSVSKGAQESPLRLEEKPTLEGCDYDTEVFSAKLEEWSKKKLLQDETIQRQKDAHLLEERRWAEKLENYNKAKSALKIPGIETAEGVVEEKLSIIQQGIIVKGARNPALLVCLLGKSPTALDNLAKITDPVEYAFALARFELEVESKMKNSKKDNPVPETSPKRGGGSSAGSAKLEALRKEAERTGDYTKVTAYKRSLK